MFRRSGHRSVLAWAEVDEDFGDAPVLLATRMDGRDLDAEGSQLVVPTDRCEARYVSALTCLRIGALPLPAESGDAPTTPQFKGTRT